MTPPSPKCTCAICGKTADQGAHFYGFKRIASWNEMVCEDCAATNWDGIVPERHPALMALLKGRGVSLQLNGKGWLPVPVV